MKYNRGEQVKGWRELNSRYGIRTYLYDTSGNFVREFTKTEDFVDFYFNPNSKGLVRRVDKNNNIVDWVV